MNPMTRMLAALAVTVAAAPVTGQEPVITSFQHNGRLTWANEVTPGAIYRVEWAATPAGPWFRTLQNTAGIDALEESAFEALVPMFYRVVMSTEPPPRGMKYVEQGPFQMGQTGVAEPVHTNHLSAFWIDEKEVSKALWDEVSAWAVTRDYAFNATPGGKSPDHPVQRVSWYDALKWCNARSEKEGLTPIYHVRFMQAPVVYKSGDMFPTDVFWDNSGYRLPTEAEWEKAARGGRRDRLFPWGLDVITHEWANYNSFGPYPYDQSITQDHHPLYGTGSHPFTSPCGAFPSNGYGLHDMAGNVAEWVWDYYLPYSEGTFVDPRKAPGNYTIRVVRGGSWSDDASFARCAHRISVGAGGTINEIGFRTVRRP